MTQRKTFTYNPRIIATEENFDEAKKQFDQIMKDAPKPDDHPGMNIVVSPKLNLLEKK